MRDASGDSADHSVEVAQALAQVVRERGRNLAREPRQVQGMVNDVLGTESRSRRAEVDAVVIAAEESVPADLLSGRIAVVEALGRLRGRGLDDGVAMFAIDVWRYAFGMLGDNSGPPSLANSLASSLQPVARDRMPAGPAQHDLESQRPAGAPESGADARPNLAESASDSHRTRMWWLIGLGVAAVSAVALIVFSTSARSGYFVAFDDADQAIIYHGRPGGILWIDPTAVNELGPKRNELVPGVATEIDDRPVFDSADAAVDYIRNGVTTTTTTTSPVSSARPTPVPRTEGAPVPAPAPDLTNLTLDEATTALGEVLMVIVRGEDEFSGTIEVGRVVSQDPPPTTSVDRGGTVTVRISKGPDLVAFPDLDGQTFSQAQERLAAAGYTVNSLLGSMEGIFVSGAVNGDEVLPGALFPHGTGVDLVCL